MPKELRHGRNQASAGTGIVYSACTKVIFSSRLHLLSHGVLPDARMVRQSCWFKSLQVQSSVAALAVFFRQTQAKKG